MVRTLVLGGARSGKSAHAEGLVSVTEPVTYVATARRDPDDPDWTSRIAAHVARRPEHWHTVEADPPGTLPRLLETFADRAVLVDDMATWLTNVLTDSSAWDRATRNLDAVLSQRESLVSAVRTCQARLVLVSAEVGLGIVPATESGRLFRDELGVLNARLAEVCDEVILLVAGVPMRLR